MQSQQLQLQTHTPRYDITTRMQGRKLRFDTDVEPVCLAKRVCLATCVTRIMKFNYITDMLHISSEAVHCTYPRNEALLLLYSTIYCYLTVLSAGVVCTLVLEQTSCLLSILKCQKCNTTLPSG